MIDSQMIKKISKFINNKNLIKFGPIFSIIVGITTLITFVQNHKNYPKFDGKWIVKFHVINSSYKAYINDEYVYEVYVNQTDNIISGNGEQKLYNSKIAKKHFKIEWSDIKIDKQFKITYKLHGTRKTSGLMELQIDKNNKKHLVGKFHGAAANTNGNVEIVIE
jgi:hypothetical protein